jgi:6,7-dimethyl-8-ribityllumazine synthase
VAEFEGVPDGRGRRIAVLVSRFNATITQRLEEGAIHVLLRSGVADRDLDIIRVPGAWELAGAARTALATERYDALVALGAVIRGETPHFEYVASAASRGLADAAAEFDVPIGFGVLTCDTMAQADARSGGDHGNKGADAALAALEMVDLLARLDVPAAAEDEEASGRTDHGVAQRVAQHVAQHVARHVADE